MYILFQDFEMIKAEVKRSQERLNPTKCLKKSTDKLTNKTRANNEASSNRNSTNVSKPGWLPSLPEEDSDSDQSSTSSDDTVIDVHISNRPKRQQSSFQGSQKSASSDSGRNSNEEEEGSDK